jgi:hypothetical protein
MRWAGHVAHMRNMKRVHCEGKRPLGRPKLQLADDISPLKLMFVYIIFKNSAHTSKRTPHFTITKINWLTLFKEIITVYSVNHTEPIHTKCKSYRLLR